MSLVIRSWQTAFFRDMGPEERVPIRYISIPASSLERIQDELAKVGDGKPNYLEVSTQQMLLDLAFKFGQNDVQPQVDRYSMSMGDVVELPDGTLWRCMAIGWDPLPALSDPVALRGRAAREAASVYKTGC